MSLPSRQPTADELKEAVRLVTEANDIAEAAQRAYFATPWWRPIRRHKAWNEWGRSIAAFKPFNEHLEQAMQEVE